MNKKRKIAILGSTLALLGSVAVMTHAQADEPEQRVVTVKAKLNAPYLAVVEIKAGGWADNLWGDTTGSLDAGFTKYLTLNAATDGSEVWVKGIAVAGKSTTYKIPVDGLTRCYEFRGTTIVGFKFDEVSCDGFPDQPA